MSRWIVLGSAHSIAAPHAANTHFALVTTRRIVLVDCPGPMFPHLTRYHLSPHRITDLVLTHFHPDHVSGLALFLQNLWLVGRTRPLHLHGLPDVLDRARRLLDLFRWHRWKREYPVHFHAVEGPGLLPLLREPDVHLYAAEVKHSVPTLGLRFAFPESGRVLAYSADTAPCPAVEDLARGADWLFHEATGAGSIHTSAAQAGELARRAGVRHVFLVHTDPDPRARHRLEEEARRAFGGPVTAAWDGLTLVWEP